MPKKYTYEKVRSIFEENNCILLDEQYKNNRTSLKYICECGNKSKITLEKFLIGQRCTNCGKEKRANSKRVLTFEHVKNMFCSNGYDLLETRYHSCLQTLKYRCPNGHIGTTTCVNFQRGHRCQKCSAKSGENHHKWNHDREQVKQNALFAKKSYNALHRCLRATKQNKVDKTSNLLGYTINDLQEHIKLHPDWGEVKDLNWHLDHIFPIKAFIDNGIEDLKIINHLENLRPCTSIKNMSKNAKYNEQEFKEWLRKI